MKTYLKIGLLAVACYLGISLIIGIYSETTYRAELLSHFRALSKNYFIQKFGLIETNNKGQWLAIITKTPNYQQKVYLFFIILKLF